MKQPAFTLIELIIVITIIGIIIGFIIIDFSSSMQRQEMAIAGDQAIAMMQQSGVEVQSGKTNGDLFLCEGAYLKLGYEPKFAFSTFDALSNDCDFSGLRTETYGVSSNKVHVSAMQVGGLEVDELWALFKPPDAKIEFYSATGERLSNDALITLEHKNNKDLSLNFSISAMSNRTILKAETNAVYE